MNDHFHSLADDHTIEDGQSQNINGLDEAPHLDAVQVLFELTQQRVFVNFLQVIRLMLDLQFLTNIFGRAAFYLVIPIFLLLMFGLLQTSFLIQSLVQWEIIAFVVVSVSLCLGAILYSQVVQNRVLTEIHRDIAENKEQRVEMETILDNLA